MKYVLTCESFFRELVSMELNIDFIGLGQLVSFSCFLCCKKYQFIQLLNVMRWLTSVWAWSWLNLLKFPRELKQWELQHVEMLSFVTRNELIKHPGEKFLLNLIFVDQTRFY